MPAGPATGQAVALPGADFIDYDPIADRIAKVTGYFGTCHHAHPARPAGAHHASRRRAGHPVRRWPAHRHPAPGHPGGLHRDVDASTQNSRSTLIDAVTSVVMEARQQRLPRLVLRDYRARLHVHRLGERRSATAALRTGAHAAAMRLAKGGGTADDAFGVSASGNQKCSTRSSTQARRGPGPDKADRAVAIAQQKATTKAVGCDGERVRVPPCAGMADPHHRAA